MITDPIADMLPRIRNAQMVRHIEVRISHSQFKETLARLLLREGYIEQVNVQRDNGRPVIVIQLKYYRGRPVIDQIRRVSRPGLRNYVSRNELPRVLGGLGIAIISTSQGLMTDREARKTGIGGEVICTVQ